MSSTDRNRRVAGLRVLLVLLALAAPLIQSVAAHGVSDQDKGLIGTGLQLGRFTYLGALSQICGNIFAKNEQSTRKGSTLTAAPGQSAVKEECS